MNITANPPTWSKIHAAIHDLITPVLQCPYDLHINAKGDANLPHFTITVAECDMGRVVGKQGNNFFALKSLIKLMGAGQGLLCAVTLQDPVPGNPRKTLRRTPWEIEQVKEAIEAFFAVAGIPAAVAITAQHNGRNIVLISPKKESREIILAYSLPEDVSVPLGKWISAMGIEGNTRLILDDA